MPTSSGTADRGSLTKGKKDYLIVRARRWQRKATCEERGQITAEGEHLRCYAESLLHSSGRTLFHS